jgi:hypothetical protein
MPKAVHPAAGTVTVHVPIAFHRRGGRKIVTALGGSGAVFTPVRSSTSCALVKAVARAFRWRKLLETGVYSTIQEIAAAEKVNASYIGRVLQLTLLAPDVVEAILDDNAPSSPTIDAVMRSLPAEWAAQRHSLPAALRRVSA